MNDTEPPRRGLPRNVWLLGWVSLLNDIASEMVYPLLERLMDLLPGGGQLYLGVMEGVANSISSLLKLFAGAWSDRTGKRKAFVVCGYFTAAVARPLGAIVALPWQLVALRSADRVGKGIRTPPRDAMIADGTLPGERGRAFGVQRAMDQFGAAVGPLLALALLWAWPGNLKLVFLLTAVPGAAVLALLLFGVKETLPKSVAGQSFTLTLKPFGGRFRLLLFALVVFTLGNTSDLFLLHRARELGANSLLLWAAFNVVTSLGSAAAGPWIDRLGAKVMILGGWLLYAAVYLAFALSTSAWQVCTLFVCYGLFYSLTEPAEKALVANLADGSRYRGLAYGWYNFAVGITTLPANIFFGWLYDRHGPLWAFGFGACMALLAAVLLLGVRIPRDAPARA